jgi:hypothetical protein
MNEAFHLATLGLAFCGLASPFPIAFAYFLGWRRGHAKGLMRRAPFMRVRSGVGRVTIDGDVELYDDFLVADEGASLEVEVKGVPRPAALTGWTP